MPRITDPRALACSRYPGSLHEHPGSRPPVIHGRYGNGCWAQFSSPPDAEKRAQRFAAEESARCAAAKVGSFDHACAFPALKGWVAWAYCPQDPTTKETGGFALFCADTREAALAEARAAA